jgi:hypothetical protein
MGAAAEASRVAAAELASFGTQAIPAIEGALDSIEKYGSASDYIGGGWLLYSYAKIKGSAAYPRLRRMQLRPGLGGLKDAFSGSIALALGLTSYIVASDTPLDVFCRAQVPRDTLDRFVLAWMKHNRSLMEECIGPNARVALNSLLQGKNWTELQSEYWPDGASNNAAMGYRLEIPGPWADPTETLVSDPGVVRHVRDPENPTIPVVFTNSSGRDCGRQTIKFLSPTRLTALPWRYLIDNADLGDLLRTISSCAVRPPTIP